RWTGRARAPARRSVDRADSRRGRYLVCDDGRPEAAARRGLRRLSREADQRSGVRRPGARFQPGCSALGNPVTADAGATNGRILVVDDVARNVRLLQAVLEPAGFEVVAAGSGRVALSLVRDRSPDQRLTATQQH